MDIASLRAKLDNIAEELAQLPEQEIVAVEEEAVEEGKKDDEEHELEKLIKGSPIDMDASGPMKIKKMKEEEQVEEESFNVAMAKLKKKEKAAGVSDDFYGKADQDYDALIKAYDSKSEREQLGMMDPDKLDDPTTKLPQISPKKKMGKLDDPTTKLPQVAEEEVEETVEVPVAALAELMQLAGYSNYADKLQEYENEPDEDYSDTEDQMIGLSGGLNGPKNMHTPAAGGDNPMDKEALKTVEESLYKSYAAFLEEAEIAEKE